MYSTAFLFILEFFIKYLILLPNFLLYLSSLFLFPLFLSIDLDLIFSLLIYLSPIITFYVFMFLLYIFNVSSKLIKSISIPVIDSLFLKQLFIFIFILSYLFFSSTLSNFFSVYHLPLSISVPFINFTLPSFFDGTHLYFLILSFDTVDLIPIEFYFIF